MHGRPRGQLRSRRAVEALVQRDDAKAPGRDRRRRSDRRPLPRRSTHEILQLLALQSPVAADLRLVSAILHSCLHLERIGDQAVNVAKIYLADAGTLPRQRADACSSSKRWARIVVVHDPHRDGGVRDAATSSSA